MLMLGVPVGAAAQQVLDQRETIIKSKVNVVSLLATVHDRDGKVVKNLTQNDFVLLEDGLPQKISYFSQESDLPLSIGLLVDTSRSQTRVLKEEREASYTFFDQVLREEKDQAFVAHFDTQVEISQGLTSSIAQLDEALRRLIIPEEPATLIYSAVKDCSEKVMRGVPGRKAFILLTDGVAYRETTSIGSAIEFAQRADTIIYVIRFSDPPEIYRPLGAAVGAATKEYAKHELHRMAEETGGVSYDVTKRQSIEEIYSQIEETLRSQYSIGYTPTRIEADGQYHKIKLSTRERRLAVHTRDGYYASDGTGQRN
jgi:VWFA-related protein